MELNLMDVIRLDRVKNECFKMIEKDNIGCYPFTVTVEEMDQWGDVDFQKNQIKLSSKVLKYNDMFLKTVLIHELLHLIVGDKYHRGKWKEYAEIVNNNSNLTICKDYFKPSIQEQLKKKPKD